MSKLADLVATIETDVEEEARKVGLWVEAEATEIGTQLVALVEHVAKNIEPALVAAFNAIVPLVIDELGHGVALGEVFTSALGKLEPAAQAAAREADQELLTGIVGIMTSAAKKALGTAETTAGTAGADSVVGT